jgi:hypothetical protein
LELALGHQPRPAKVMWLMAFFLLPCKPCQEKD